MWTVNAIFQETQHETREVESIGWWVGCVIFNYFFVWG